MLKVTCINCGNQYRVKEELAGKVLRCPHCRMPVRVGTDQNGEASADQLRDELLRLAGGARESTPAKERKAPATADKLAPKTRKRVRRKAAAAPAAAAAAATPVVDSEGPVRPSGASAAAEASETAEEGGPEMRAARKDYTAVIIGVIILMTLAVAGALGVLRYRAYQAGLRRQRQDKEGAVTQALAEARGTDAECREREAIDAWEDARKLAHNYEQEYGFGNFVTVITEAEQRVAALKAELVKRQEAAGKIADLVAAGQERIEKEDFKGARKDLTEALQLRQQETCASDEVQQAAQAARMLLASEEIVNTHKGLVKYEGKWVLPSERLALIRQAKIDEMKAKGLVEYKGQWMTPEERDKLIDQERVALLQQQEEERSRRERAERWERLRTQQMAVQRAITNGEATVVIDSSAESPRWTPETWGNPVELRIEAYGIKGEEFVTVVCREGSKDKWVISVPQPADTSDYDEVHVDLVAPDNMTIALGVWTRPGDLFESQPMPVAKGARTLRYDLRANNFKCKDTKWLHRAALQNPENVFKFSLFVYTPVKEPLRFKAFRLVKKPKPAEPKVGG